LACAFVITLHAIVSGSIVALGDEGGNGIGAQPVPGNGKRT
jgi:hypothetical protein